jgi:hypothetical protein
MSGRMNRKTVGGWILYVLLVVGVIIQLVFWLKNLTGRPSLFELVEALGWALGLPIVFASLAVLIISRQPENRVGWLMMVTALAAGNPISIYFDYYLTPQNSLTLGLLLLLWLDGWSWIPIIFPIFLIPLHFPTGRPPSARWNWVNTLAIGMWLFFIITTFFVDQIGPIDSDWVLPNPVGFIPQEFFEGPAFMLPWGAGLITVLSSSITSLFVRYRRAHFAERQQIKWLLYAGAFFLIIYAIIFINAPSELENGWTNLIFVLSILAIPIAITIAILRYRLFDIDVIIRRTVQYSLVTGLLGLAYFGSIVLLQNLFGGLAAQNSPLVIVFSTLLIAALFNPLRRRVQNFIDRRFYRQKYDAEQALAEFAAVARRETDLGQLTAHLTTTVQETLQPQDVSMWMVAGSKRKVEDQGGHKG